MAQRDYVVIDLEKKEDRVTFILHEAYYPFNKNECENGSPDAACFNLEKEFQDYACNAPWMGKRLGRLLNNVTRVNGALLEARKGKKKTNMSHLNDTSVFQSLFQKSQDPPKVEHQEGASRQVNALTHRLSLLGSQRDRMSALQLQLHLS